MRIKADTLIFTHSDCDGICAGALALGAFPGAKVFFTKPVSLLRDLRDVAVPSGAKRLVICDIALTKVNAAEVLKEVSKLKSDIMYFDHHVIPETASLDKINGSAMLYAHDTNASASEIVYRHFQKALPAERVWLALYGAIGDYTAGTPFSEERMRSWDRMSIGFEASAIVLGIKEEKFSGYSAKRRIVSDLASGRNPSEIAGLVAAAKDAVAREYRVYSHVKSRARSFGSIGYVTSMEHFGFRGPAALFAATVTDKPVGLAVFRVHDHLDVTARTRANDPAMKLNKVMEKAAEAVGGSGGGHPRAAGARIPKGMLNKFIAEADRLL